MKAREDLLGYTLDQLGEAVSGVIVDEAGFIKKGAPSVGVQRHHTGATGTINSQLRVFLAYAASRGQALIGSELIRPASTSWAIEEC